MDCAVPTSMNPHSKKRRFAPNSGLSVLQPRDNYNPDYQRDMHVERTKEEIDRDLLHVGMRVRKSVAEGYKTVAMPRPSFNMYYDENSTDEDFGAEGLEPPLFLDTSAFDRENRAPYLYQQWSWTYSSTHKRGFDSGESDGENDHEFMPHTPQLKADEQSMPIPMDYFNIDVDNFDENSPMTDPYQFFAPKAPVRRLAVPKSRKLQGLGPIGGVAQFQMNGVHWMGHTRTPSCGVDVKTVSMFDFGEATFLQNREDVDMDWS